MIGTLFYYIACSTKNHVVRFARRLRQPKYLISALAGFGYFYFFFMRQFVSHPRARAAPPIPLDLNALPLLETGLAFALLGLILLPWIWPGRGTDGLRFTEAEIQFLFPAPVSRRALIHFRLAKMQLGIFFSVFISFVIFGRGRFFDHPLYFVVALWIVYSFIAFYSVGVSLSQMSLRQHGASGIWWQLWALGLLAILIVSILVWVKWYIPPLPADAVARPADFMDWLLRATRSGPAYYFLAPFKAFVRPAFASNPGAFLVNLVPALAILVLTYLWVIRSDVAFEEASLAKAKKIASLLAAAKSGIARSPARSAAKVRAPLFRLAPAGLAHTPIFWKNLISIGRIDMLRVMPAIVVVGISIAVMLFSRGKQGPFVPAMIGGLAGMMAGFLTLLGPMLVRDDLRSDMLEVDLLKTYPIPGWALMLGEVLAPATVLAAGEWVLILIAALFLPSIAKTPLLVSQRIVFGLSASLLLPCFSLLGVMIQNGAVLLLPGWVQLGKANRQGVEAMGQRLITMVATVLMLVFAVIPAGVLFAIIFFAGYGFIGIGVLPLASLMAALGLLAEAGAGILWLGRLYDRLDVSLEGTSR